MIERYVVLNWSFIRDKNTTMQEKLILMEIHQLSMMDKGCIASNNHFSDLMGIKKESVSRLISSLEKKGFIVSKIEPGSRNHSRVITINKMLFDPKQNVIDPLTNCLESKENKIIHAPKETLEAFENLWKDYTLTFLKRQNRGGGTKAKAKEKYLKLVQKYSPDEVYKFVENHASLKIGHKDLERLLTHELIKQHIEDLK